VAPHVRLGHLLDDALDYVGDCHFHVPTGWQAATTFAPAVIGDILFPFQCCAAASHEALVPKGTCVTATPPLLTGMAIAIIRT
jgi:hypothetical protein